MSGPALVVLIAGNAGHGKDTFADALAAALDPHGGCARAAFADAVKDVALHLVGIPLEVSRGTPEDKRSIFYEKSVRHWLQWIGTEVGRQGVAAAVWTDRMVDRIKRSTAAAFVISDGRFRNEFARDGTFCQQVKALGVEFVTVRVHRQGVVVDATHMSEREVVQALYSDFDFVRENHGSLEAWRETAARLGNELRGVLAERELVGLRAENVKLLARVAVLEVEHKQRNFRVGDRVRVNPPAGAKVSARRGEYDSNTWENYRDWTFEVVGPRDEQDVPEKGCLFISCVEGGVPGRYWAPAAWLVAAPAPTVSIGRVESFDDAIRQREEAARLMADGVELATHRRAPVKHVALDGPSGASAVCGRDRQLAIDAADETYVYTPQSSATCVPCLQSLVDSGRHDLEFALAREVALGRTIEPASRPGVEPSTSMIADHKAALGARPGGKT